MNPFLPKEVMIFITATEIQPVGALIRVENMRCHPLPKSCQLLQMGLGFDLCVPWSPSLFAAAATAAATAAVAAAMPEYLNNL